MQWRMQAAVKKREISGKLSASNCGRRGSETLSAVNTRRCSVRLGREIGSSGSIGLLGLVGVHYVIASLSCSLSALLALTTINDAVDCTLSRWGRRCLLGLDLLRACALEFKSNFLASADLSLIAYCIVALLVLLLSSGFSSIKFVGPCSNTKWQPELFKLEVTRRCQLLESHLSNRLTRDSRVVIYSHWESLKLRQVLNKRKG